VLLFGSCFGRVGEWRSAVTEGGGAAQRAGGGEGAVGVNRQLLAL
jgi:hypothetical protein